MSEPPAAPSSPKALPSSTAASTVTATSSRPQTALPPPALKSTTTTAATRLVQQHRRVFSHGHISFGGQEVQENSSSPVKSTEDGMPPRSGGHGHKRTASKTDFILPPDHDEREKKRSSLQREPQQTQQTRLVSKRILRNV